MPILGDLNSTNPIYLKAIREVLNEDQRINKQVVDLQKKQASIFMQSVVPQNTLINKANTDNMDALVNAFNKKAENINLSIGILNREKQRGEIEQVSATKFKEIMEVYDVLSYYNNIVSLLRSPTISQAEKAMLENKAMTILPIIESVRFNFNNLIRVLQETSTNDEMNMPILSVYSLFNLMSSNLNSRNYSNITYNDVQTELNKVIVKEFPVFKDAANLRNQIIRDNAPLIRQQYRLFEQENGRKPTDREKEQIQRQYTNNIYDPIFSKKTTDLLEKYNDMANALPVSMAESLPPVRHEPTSITLSSDENQKEIERLNKNLEDINNKIELAKTIRNEVERVNKLDKLKKDKKEIKRQLKPLKERESNREMTEGEVISEFDMIKEALIKLSNKIDKEMQAYEENPTAEKGNKIAELYKEKDELEEEYNEKVSSIPTSRATTRDTSRATSRATSKAFDDDDVEPREGFGKRGKRVYMQRKHNKALDYDGDKNDTYIY